jgi:hypothetical protein
VVWLGVFPERFEETERFFRDVVGLREADRDQDVTQLQTDRGDIVELFRPHARYEFAGTGSIPGFLVDDVPAAADDLRRSSTELLGEAGGWEDHSWQHFRAPDGNVYEVTAGPYEPESNRRGLPWAGVRTAATEGMAEFCRDVLGMTEQARLEGLVKLRMAGGDEFEVFAQEEPDHLFMDTGPVVAFEVEDLGRTRSAIEAAGMELFGEPRSEGPLTWQHFRAPDGCVYEILHRS